VETPLPPPNIDDLVPVVLAGGSGTRLWPASRAALPKHLVDLFGDSSLLQETVRRITAIAPFGRLVTVAAASQAMLIHRQLEALNEQFGRHVVLEPEGRNTAAAVALAAICAESVWGVDALLWICPSDHLMTRPAELHAAVAAGVVAARAGRLVTFGITATRPETGYGYIRTGQPLPDAPGVLGAASFVEKPPAERARAMLAEGDHVWNSGMFLFRVGTILAELQAHVPALLAAVRAATRPGPNGRLDVEPELFAAVPALPIDKAVMECSDRVAVVPCAPGWSDVGSWQAIWEIEERDATGNAVSGDALVVGGRDNLVRAEGRLVAVAGVDDLAVIETADAVMVAPRADADAVKALVGRLAELGRPEVVRHRREPMAWGTLTRLVERSGYAILERRLDPGAALTFSGETLSGTSWTIVEGRCRVVVGDAATVHGAGAVVIAQGRLPHRLVNAGPGSLLLVELRRN
jgi:mannose-1-phosphate guanylyltransferase/mannose-1-phosphate guanylyltransferase/mannose-6-phosphate isomerase